MTEDYKAKKADYNRRYREKKKSISKEIDKLSAPNDIDIDKLSAPNQIAPNIAPDPKKKPKPIIKQQQSDDDDDNEITIEDYVEYLVNQKTQKKKIPELIQTQSSTSGSSYSSFMFLVPLLLPLIKASSDVAFKYLTKPKEPTEEQQFSLNSLLSQ